MHSIRLKRIRMKLLLHNIGMKFVPGKQLLVADTLSRAFLENEFGDEENLDEIVHAIAMTDEWTRKMEQETKKDAILSGIVRYFITWMADRPDKGERAMEHVLEAERRHFCGR